MSTIDSTTGRVDPDHVDNEEFMLEPVPLEARRPTWKQVMVWIGFGYVVTGLFVGGVLAGYGGKPGVPPGTAIAAIAVGMGLLAILTFAMGVAAQRTGLNLYLLSRYSYGRLGVNIPLAVMSLLTLGWFASITGMVGQIWGSLFGNVTGITVFDPAALGKTGIPPITLEVFITCLLFGLLFTWTAYKGIEAIEKVAIPVAPLIMIIAILVGVGMLNEGGGMGTFLDKANQLGGLGFGTALTVVMGSWIAGAVMGVDLFRFNKNIAGVAAGAIACFILTNPLLNIVGYVGAISVGQFDYVPWMAKFGLIFALIGVFAWTTSLWTTNNAELYCNALYTGPILDSMGKRVKRTTIVLIVGIVGTIIGSLAFYQMFFNDFITFLGAAFLPLAGPIIADYFIVKKRRYNLDRLHDQPPWRWAGVISFLIGAVLGIVLEFFVKIPAVLPSGVIALIVTMILYPIIYNATDKKHDVDAVPVTAGE